MAFNGEYRITGSKSKEEATVFKVHEINSRARISCEIGGKTYFWSISSNKSDHITLKKKSNEPEQNFRLFIGSGGGLIKFGYGKSPSYSVKLIDGVLKKTSERSSNTEIKTGCLVNRMPTNETFLVYPENDDITFYCGLGTIHILRKHL